MSVNDPHDDTTPGISREMAKRLAEKSQPSEAVLSERWNVDDTTPPWAEQFPLDRTAYHPCPLSVTDTRHLVDRCVLDKAIALLARLDSAHPASAEFAQACLASKMFRQQHGGNERLLRGDVQC